MVAQAESLIGRILALKLGEHRSSGLRIKPGPDAVTARALDIGMRIIANMRCLRRVDPLFGEVLRKELIAFAGAVLA